MAKETKKTSRLWSMKELKKMAEIVQLAVNSGKSKGDALQEAADYFGVTRNAIHVRYLRYKKGQSLPRVKRNTIKKPTKGMKRGPYKKRKLKINPILEDADKKLVFPISLLTAHQPKIKELIVDFDNRAITYTY
ncbi:MAG: hypothetical protein E6R13_08335 [Spirochaetes bacterium]|nr:MAG: hypothetical protein E6R13_08335 [Spirochaetota bacterium]